jgi:hypothetical protein
VSLCIMHNTLHGILVQLDAGRSSFEPGMSSRHARSSGP